MDLSVLLSNSSYELMNILTEYGAYFDRNENSIQAEKMHFIEMPKEPGEMDSDEEEFEKKWRNNETGNVAGNQTGFKKTSSVSALSVGSPFKAGKNDYQRAVTNLD